MGNETYEMAETDFKRPHLAFKAHKPIVKEAGHTMMLDEVLFGLERDSVKDVGFYNEVLTSKVMIK